MIDFEQGVRDSLQTYGGSVDVGAPRLDDVFGRARRRTRRVAAATASVVLLGAVTAIGVIARTDDANRSVVPAIDDTAVTESGDQTSLPTTPEKLASLLDVGAKLPLPPGPLGGRSEPAAVWTGDLFLIWGGVGYGPTSGESALADGAAYDPVANTWTPLPPSPIAGRGYPAAVWTGDEMLVWGGGAGGKSISDGAAYNPATETWRTLAPFTMANTIRPTVTWTGKEMIVLEGINGGNHGAAYNPSTDTWRTIAAPPGRSVTPYPQSVWTGERVIVELGAAPNDQPILAEYDPSADSWQTMNPPPIPSGGRPALVWTGTELLMLGGGTNPNAAWTPGSDTWRTLAETDIAMVSNTPVWTGNAALFWNGGDTAVAYIPATDSWQTLTGGSLTARASPATVWADGILLSWSGFQNNADGSAFGAADGLAWRPDIHPAGQTNDAPPATSTAAATEPNGSDGPRLWVQPLFQSQESLAAPVEGILRYDANNDCFLLERNNELFPVVWPAGTSATATGPTVTSNDGTEIQIGHSVSGAGGYLDVAEQVGIPAACVPASGEVAVFNTDATLRTT
jgi:hypothetical protein